MQSRTAFALLVAATISIDTAHAAEVKVMAANALKEAYLELVSCGASALVAALS
jgi:hypothetical protein